MKGSTPAADVFLIKRGAMFKADPPRQKVHPATRNQLCIRNLTGSTVVVWFPTQFLVGEPAAESYTIEPGAARCFSVPAGAEAGVYPYAAYVSDAREFVEGNTPPDIIIDR